MSRKDFVVQIYQFRMCTHESTISIFLPIFGWTYRYYFDECKRDNVVYWKETKRKINNDIQLRV